MVRWCGGAEVLLTGEEGRYTAPVGDKGLRRYRAEVKKRRGPAWADAVDRGDDVEGLKRLIELSGLVAGTAPPERKPLHQIWGAPRPRAAG